MKMSGRFTLRGEHIFQVSPEHLQNLQRLQLSLVFSGILMLASVLFPFGNIFLENRETNFEVGVAVHVVKS